MVDTVCGKEKKVGGGGGQNLKTRREGNDSFGRKCLDIFGLNGSLITSLILVC